MATMPDGPPVTRFAPSPTGHLHLGNARTAFFSWLAARGNDGRFVLRIEDTDAARGDPALIDRLLDDLEWLGLDWDEGPDRGGPHGPYLQSERGAVYEAAITALRAARRVYPCFCTPQELELSRRVQLAAGRPPRYAGTCAALSDDEAQERHRQGRVSALRFRVPPGRAITFDDLVHGAQRFASDDIGDFVVARADGSAAFLLSNAVDDARMQVDLVLRGDDHLANTPRQLLLLEALGLASPAYGHLPLLLAPGGAPLSKRDGVAGLRELRAQGYLPAAIANYLLRLGHAGAPDHWLEPAEMPRHFRLASVSRSAAHYDETQLQHWQREAVRHASPRDLLGWLGSRLDPLGSDDRRERFVAVVRGNLLFPADADELVGVISPGEVAPARQAVAVLSDAGPEFFAQAIATLDAAADFAAWTRAIASASGRRGAALYKPLRAALTGGTQGPELAPLFELMGPGLVAARLRAAERRATSV
jgi:glutamyl-tRNA synthetase